MVIAWKFIYQLGYPTIHALFELSFVSFPLCIFILIVKHSLFCFVHKNLDVLPVITVLDQQTAFAMEIAFGQTNV